MNYYKINIVQKLIKIKIKLMMEYFNMGGGITPPEVVFGGPFIFTQAWQQRGDSQRCSLLCRTHSLTNHPPKELILDVALTAVHVSGYY